MCVCMNIMYLYLLCMDCVYMKDEDNFNLLNCKRYSDDTKFIFVNCVSALLLN